MRICTEAEVVLADPKEEGEPFAVKVVLDLSYDPITQLFSWVDSRNRREMVPRERLYLIWELRG